MKRLMLIVAVLAATQVSCAVISHRLNPPKPMCVWWVTQPGHTSGAEDFYGSGGLDGWGAEGDLRQSVTVTTKWGSSIKTTSTLTTFTDCYTGWTTVLRGDAGVETMTCAQLPMPYRTRCDRGEYKP